MAPPYAGEGAHALWHVSEDPGIPRFEPHRSATALTEELLVWAVDTRHLPLFWFPRHCPRTTYWAGPRTTADDIERFLHGQAALRVHGVESAWLDRMRDALLFAYRMPEAPFRWHGGSGYWVSREAVEPLEIVAIDDLIDRHARAGIELRVAPNLWPLWDRVITSTLKFSGIRLRYAQARPG